MTTDPGDLVLDPTCGSGTTAYVAEQWGRRWITIDTSRVALASSPRSDYGSSLSRTTLLADSPSKVSSKQAEITRTIPSEAPTYRDLRSGFLYTSAFPTSHSGRSLTTPRLDMIWQEFQATLEPLRAQLNTSVWDETWDEWQIPPRHWR